MDGEKVLREQRGDHLMFRPGLLEESEAIEFDDRSSITHRNTGATTVADTDPCEPTVDIENARFRAQPPDTDYRIKVTGSNRAHAVAQTENTPRRWIASVCTLVNHDPHFALVHVHDTPVPTEPGHTGRFELRYGREFGAEWARARRRCLPLRGALRQELL